MLKYVVIIVGLLMLTGGGVRAQEDCNSSGPWMSGTDSAEGFQQLLDCAKQRIAEAQSNLDELSDINVDAFAIERDQLYGLLQNRNSDVDDAKDEIARLNSRLDDLNKQIDTQTDQLEALKAENEDLEAALQKADGDLKDFEKKIAALGQEREILEQERDEATGRAAVLQDQIDNLTIKHSEQVERLLQKIADLETQIDNLTKTFLAEIASLECKVDRLGEKRSEFFTGLSEALGTDSRAVIIGDRFLLPSTVLFAVGSADLNEEGSDQIVKVAGAVRDLDIDPSIGWVVQVDGHTDRQKIKKGSEFKDNWELSTARALAVVRLLQDLEVPPKNLVAAGFGEYHPIDDERTPEAYKRNRRIELKLTDDGSGNARNGTLGHSSCE